MSRTASIVTFALSLSLSAPAWAFIFVGNPVPDVSIDSSGPTLDKVKLEWSFSETVTLESAVADIDQLVLHGCAGTPQQGQTHFQSIDDTVDLAVDWDVNLAAGAWCVVEMELNADITLEGLDAQSAPFSLDVDPGVIKADPGGQLASSLQWTAAAL